MQNEDKKVGEIKAVEPSENQTINGSCDICGAKGQVTEKLDTHSMNYYNHCNKKECVKYSDLEPSEELPKYKFKKWEEYYTKAVDLIERKFSHRNRQWCHDQLNRSLDNTEFHNLDTDAFDSDQNYELKCQIIDEILAGEFGIYTQLQEEIRLMIFGENNDCCDRSLMSRFYDKIDLPSGDLSPDQSLEFDKIADDLSRWYARHLTQNNGKIKESK